MHEEQIRAVLAVAGPGAFVGPQNVRSVGALGEPSRTLACCEGYPNGCDHVWRDCCGWVKDMGHGCAVHDDPASPEYTRWSGR